MKTRPPSSRCATRQRRPRKGRGARAPAHSQAGPPESVSSTARYPSGDELSRPSLHRDPPVGATRRAAEGGQVAAQGRAGRRALLCDD
eukprot:scaffold40643_cov66-Phaeocystis_antarctica.AAC.3